MASKKKSTYSKTAMKDKQAQNVRITGKKKAPAGFKKKGKITMVGK